MMHSTRDKTLLILLIVSLSFLALRFLGVSQIYHQDEYRWATIANPVFDDFLGPHPPITRYLLRGAGYMFGFDWLRVIPLLFGLLNAGLLYVISQKLTTSRIAALMSL